MLIYDSLLDSCVFLLRPPRLFASLRLLALLNFCLCVFLRIGGVGVGDPESEKLLPRPPRHSEEGGDSAAGGRTWTGNNWLSCSCELPMLSQLRGYRTRGKWSAAITG